MTQKENELVRMKRLAIGFLIAAALLFITSRLHHGEPFWDWVEAFSEAAMIGALADWFAVVALFRHPLGLPVPHTAILQRNKNRVADNLAEFIRNKFLEPDALADRVRTLNPAERLAEWLRNKENTEMLGEKLVALFSEMLDFIYDDRVRQVLRETLREQAERINIAEIAGKTLDTLVEDNRHQALLDEGLKRLAVWLDDRKVQEAIANLIARVGEREYPQIVSMLGIVTDTEKLNRKLADSIVRGVNEWLHEIAENPNHEKRHDFNMMAFGFIDRLKHDPQFQERVEGTKRELLDSLVVSDYVDGLWLDFKGWLQNDLRNPQSLTRQRIVDAARILSETLAGNPALRDSINDHLEKAVRLMTPDLRDGMARHIAETVKGWDDEMLIREVEHSIGRDLQFIRLNGTVVGGIVGLLIHAVSIQF